MENHIFVVMMSWNQDGITMRPCESFMTRPEAEKYVGIMKDDWEIVEVRLPYKLDFGYLLKPVEGVKDVNEVLCACGDKATHAIGNKQYCAACHDFEISGGYL